MMTHTAIRSLRNPIDGYPVLPVLVCAIVLCLSGPAKSQGQTGGDPFPTIETKTAGMTARPGFFTLYWDEATGHLFWEIDRFEEEFLYAVSLAAGLGSNPVGLDRGQLGSSHILFARRVGPRVLLIEPNYGFRATHDDRAVARAVSETFAPSTLWGFPIAAETGERVLVDATDFFMQDAHGAAARLSGGGAVYRLDPSRSVFHLSRTKVFDFNCEIETWLTFTAVGANREIRGNAPSANAVTLREHHSLVELPGPGYEPREADPRVSAGAITVHDFGAAVDEPIVRRYVRRHRLIKRNPRAARSEPVEPIVYYVDPGAPEPIRTALVEGAAWWNEAFEFAGFIDAFQVRVLPDGADPQDLRYNMIHFTNRSERGWSYGGSVIDPRTGEIIKGNVNLGALRLRQDQLLARGLVPQFASAAGVATDWSLAGLEASDGPDAGYLAAFDPATDAVELALARVRQLSCHEVGHTLGFGHNYAASTCGRASVMDYPAPTVTITRGRIDLSDAYPVGVGEYDKYAVKWLYAEFGPGADEQTELDRIIHERIEAGIRYAADAEATPMGAAHPFAAQWDNGADPAAYLEHEIEVRRLGLEAFGEANVRPGSPLAALEEVLVPLYLHHRYQVKAAAHSIGGALYEYALRGDGQTPLEIVAPEKQREALALVLATLEPDFLALPERILALIPPRAAGMIRGETFTSSTAPLLDPIGMAATAADLTTALIVQPERMARLVTFHARQDRYPGLEEVIEALLDATWYAPVPDDAYRTKILEAVQQVVLDRLTGAAGSAGCTPAVRAVLNAELHALFDRIEAQTDRSPFRQLALEELARWFARPEGLTPASGVPPIPQGSPIGTLPPPAVPPGSPIGAVSPPAVPLV